MARKDKARKAGGRARAVLPRLWWAWGLVLAALCGAAVGHVRSRLSKVQLGYALSQAASEHRELQDEKRKLMVEAATLRNPRRLRRLAVEQLDLVEPSSRQIIRTGSEPGGKLAMGR